MVQSRRDFLKVAAMLSGAAGASGFVPESIQRAFAIEPEPGSTYMDAEHIVILMQENRSFDHAMGTLQGVRGFNDPRAMRLPNGNSVFVQTDAAGNSYAPWRLDIRDTRITWMGSVPHTRESQVDAWNEGRNNGWLDAKRSTEHGGKYAHLPLTMGHYTREDLPFYYALADAFTVCDQNYAGGMTSTTPNRSIFWTGTVRDEQNVNSKVYIRNDELFDGGLTWKTFPERLHEAGVSWKFYQNELNHSSGLSAEAEPWLGNYGCNVLECFAAYNVEAYQGHVLHIKEEIAALTKETTKRESSLASEKDPQVSAQLRKRIDSDRLQIEKLKASLADSGSTRYQELTGQQRDLHDAAFTTNKGDPNYRSVETIAFEDDGRPQQMVAPKGDVLHQFRSDVNNGKLPTVSWLASPERFSDHPSNPWYGAWYVSEVMDILTKNPEVWKKTIFILTYDENDGYFDHAPTFVAADPKRPATGGASAGLDTGIEYMYVEDEFRQGIPAKSARTGPIGLGFRVPMVIASPWSRGGWVNSQLFEHTSTLMFLEEFLQNKFGKKVTEENISAWRRSISGNLTSCFRPHDATEPKLDYLNRDKFVVSIQQARNKEVPSNYKKLSPAEIAEINKNPQTSQATPHQEPGIRPANALPYELYAEGNLNPDRTKFVLHLKAGHDVHGRLSAGAPFNVYLHNISNGGATEMVAATYAVKAGDTLSQEFPLTLFAGGNYSIDVHGPNGFFRSFTGNSQLPDLQVHSGYERQGAQLTGNAQIFLRNIGDNPLTVTIRDNSYRKGTLTKTIAGGHETSVVLNLEHSHGWYDFTVQPEASKSKSEVRFAGRVETGRPTFTDPLMGGVV